MSTIVTISEAEVNSLIEVDLDQIDSSLIVNTGEEAEFDTTQDTIELFSLDSNKNITATNYNYVNWRTNNDSSKGSTTALSNIELNPEEDGSNLGLYNGFGYIIYQFVNNKLSSNSQNVLYIDTISSDRTELILKSNTISGIELQNGTQLLRTEIQQNEDYFKEFYIAFEDGNKEIATNIQYEETNETSPRVLIKLYRPLPDEYDIKSTLWIQTLKADPVAYRVDFETTFDEETLLTPLRSPNFDAFKNTEERGKVTIYKSYNDLKQTNLTSSLSQIDYLLNKNQAQLSTDYTSFSNFVHFSSAKKRLENFYYKASQIESYQNLIDNLLTSPSTNYRSGSVQIYQNSIDTIIKEFDEYDYFLYYDSGSKSWPKTNSTRPYTLASTGSAAVTTWYGSDLESSGNYGGEILSASLYDNTNKDNLIFSIPSQLRDNSDNSKYLTYVEMIGQVLDELFLYTKNISSKYSGDNRLNYGSSKDLIADILRSLGLKLYENNFSSADLFSGLLGLTPSGSILLLPDITTSFPVTGSGIEYIETIVSASNDTVTLDDLNKSVYKRLYHNLPALIKKKGTLAGLRLLINTYGIPDTILRISEFGGKDKDNSNDWDYWQRKYNLKADLNGTDQVIRAFWSLDSDWNSPDDVPGTVSFRFKAEEVTADTAPTNASQSVWSVAEAIGGTTYMNTVLTYTGSAGTSGSYSGSVVDPYYQYATLTFFPDYADTTQSASIYLPFHDGGWWSVMVNRSASIYNIYAKNSIYNGDTGTEIGFQASASLDASTTHWTDLTNRRSFFGNSMDTYSKFSGSVQELRYYTTPLSESVFDDFVMNPNSIEGNSINSSADELAFRAALGGELYTGSLSIHPKSAGANPTASFGFGLDNTFQITASFSSNTEVQFLDQPAVGIKNRISDKIRLDDNNAYGTVLSNQRSLIQNTPATKKYTRDTNYLEVGFSPQNEINDDIINQIGYFNIGDYIGDPRQISSSSYTYADLEALKNAYFEKYSKSYDWNDYLRLIKFYDNSLFKMLKDFIPARTSAATGAIIKQTILERNRQKPAQVSWTRPEYSASIQPQSRGYETGSIEVVTGGPAGAVNDWIDINQSWTSSILTPEGLVTSIESYEREFYTGEYSGSVIDVVNGELQDNPLLGEAYRLSTGDLQSLYASLDGNFNGGLTHLDGGFYRGSGSLIFDQLDSEIEYYDTVSGDYTPAYTRVSNLQLNISGAYTQVEEDPTLFSFTFNFENLTTGEVLATTTYSYDNGSTFTFDVPFTASLTLNDLTVDSGSIYGLTWSGYTDAVGDGSGLTVYGTSFTSYRITVADLSKNSKYYNDPTVFAQQNFPGNLERFNDYNAIYNNVYSNRVSNKYFDVDYTNGALNPSNFGPIISQSALYAQIQDSNYDNKSAFFEARFGGTKNTGEYNFTELISSESIVANLPIDYFTNYFAYFDWVGGANPQYPGGGNVHCIYLVNAETKDTLTLSSENKNIDIISQIFKKGDPVYMLPVTAGTPSSALYDSTIVEGGALYNTIIVKSGSVPDSDTKLDIVYENSAYDGSGSLRTGTDELLSSITVNEITGSTGSTPSSFVASASNANVTASFITTWAFPDPWAVVTSVTVTGQAGFFYPTQQLIFPSASMGATTGSGQDVVITLNSSDLYTYDTTYDDIFFQRTDQSGTGPIRQNPYNLAGALDAGYNITGSTSPVSVLDVRSPDANVTASITINSDTNISAIYVTSVGDFSIGQSFTFTSQSIGATKPNGTDATITLRAEDLIYLTDGLRDAGSAPPYSAGWLSSMITGSSPTLGKVLYYGFDNDTIQIFNKTKGRYITSGSDVVDYEDTYFPLQAGDFIRFGSASLGLNGLDYNFSDNLYTVKNLTAGDYNDVKSTITVTSKTLDEDFFNQSNQNFRIFRRIPNETFTLIQSLGYTGAGLLLPKNFNPKYDPVKIATEVGIINNTN